MEKIFPSSINILCAESNKFWHRATFLYGGPCDAVGAYQCVRPHYRICPIRADTQVRPYNYNDAIICRGMVATRVV